MSDYVRGLDSQQQLLFPDRLNDYVSEDAYVRAIDAYVDGLDVEALGFKTRYSDKNNNGRPAFCPKLMLKLTIYGYNHKIRSSRHLARETHRNIDLISLVQGSRLIRRLLILEKIMPQHSRIHLRNLFCCVKISILLKVN